MASDVEGSNLLAIFLLSLSPIFHRVLVSLSSLPHIKSRWQPFFVNVLIYSNSVRSVHLYYYYYYFFVEVFYVWQFFFLLLLQRGRL